MSNSFNLSLQCHASIAKDSCLHPWKQVILDQTPQLVLKKGNLCWEEPAQLVWIIFKRESKCVGANRMGIQNAGCREEETEREDAVLPEFTYSVLDNHYSLDASDSCWLGEPLDEVNNFKPNYVQKNRTPIKLGRGRCVFRRTRSMHPVKSISSLGSCLRAQFVDAKQKEVRPGSLFSSFAEKGCHCEMPFPGFNELMSSGMNIHSGLQVFAFSASNSCARNRKFIESDNGRPCSVAHPVEDNIFFQNVKDVKRRILKGRPKLSDEADCAIEGRINHAKGTTLDQEGLSGQERQKLSIFYKKRKVSYQPSSMLCDLTKSSGSALEALLFSLGLGVGMKIVLDANRSDVDRFSKKLKEAENTVQGLRQELESRNKNFVASNVSYSRAIFTEDSNLQKRKGSVTRIDYASSDCTPAPEGCSEMALCKGDGPTQSILTINSADSVGRIAELEAEFEAELEILQLNLAKERPFFQHGFSELELDSFVDVVHGDLTISGLSVMLDDEEYDDESSESPVQPANWSVSPRELDRRLHILLQTRQEERIVEMEAELKVAQTKLEEKETLLQAWKDRVQHLTELLHSTASGDESTSVTDCSHIQTAGQLEQDSVFYDRHDRLEDRLCSSADDHENFHSLKNVNVISAGNSHHYIATSVGLSQEDLERVNAASIGKQLMAVEHSNYDTLTTSKLSFGGVTNATSEQECHAILQAKNESPKYSQIDQKKNKMADASLCCTLKFSNDNAHAVDGESKLPVDEEGEHLNTGIGTGYTVQGNKSHTSGRFDAGLSEEESETKHPKTVCGGPTACSRSLNLTDSSCSLRFSEKSSDLKTRWRGSGLLVSESKPFLIFENSSFLRGTGGEDNLKSSGYENHFKAKNTSLSIEDIGISGRYDVQDQRSSQEFGSYVSAPANTPVGPVQSMKQRLFNIPPRSALQSGIFSSKMAKVSEKMKHWEEFSKKSRKFGPELPVSPEQGSPFWSSQTDQIFPVSFTCSESDFLWDESSASDSEEHLGEVLIKRIVEKTRRRSSIMKDVQAILAELENSDTSFAITESTDLMKDSESSWNCEHDLNKRVYEDEERDKTPAGLDLTISPHNSPTKSINARKSLFKANYNEFEHC